MAISADFIRYGDEIFSDGDVIALISNLKRFCKTHGGLQYDIRNEGIKTDIVCPTCGRTFYKLKDKTVMTDFGLMHEYECECGEVEFRPD